MSTETRKAGRIPHRLRNVRPKLRSNGGLLTSRHTTARLVRSIAERMPALVGFRAGEWWRGAPLDARAECRCNTLSRLSHRACRSRLPRWVWQWTELGSVSDGE